MLCYIIFLFIVLILISIKLHQFSIQDHEQNSQLPITHLMPLKTLTYTIRIERCEKCYEHYNRPSSIQSKSYHLARKAPDQIVNKTPHFLQEQEEYRKHYQELVNALDKIQAPFLEESSLSQNEQMNYELTHSPKRLQRSRKQPYNQLHTPILKIIKNTPYKYLYKLPDTKISTKRYLNTTTKKITEFPRKDSFEVYFQNLLVFSKLSFGKWPNIRLIQKIIKCLAEYCRNQGPLMKNLKPFINDYLDIKSFNPNYSQNPPLYEYLMLTSNLESTQIETQQGQDTLIKYLKLIIDGKIKVLTVTDPKNYLSTEQTFRNKDVLPYSLVDQKVKSSTMQGIYLGKENRVDRSLKHSNQQSAVRFNFIQAKVQSTLSTQKPLVSKSKNRPLSSNLGHIRKSPSLMNGFNTNRNQLFAMIKMGDIQQNLLQQQENNMFYSFQQQKKQYQDKQLQRLCSINIKEKTTVKSQGKITKRAKLFVNTQFNPIKTQNKEHKNNQDSFIWTKFQKQSNHSKRNSKNSQINEADEWEQQDDLNKQTIKIASNQRNSVNTLLKIVPSKKIKRASLFLNQRQSNLLAQQLQNLTQNSQSNQNNQSQQPSNELSKNSCKNQRNSKISAILSNKSSQRSKTYKECDQQSSSGDTHSVYSKASDEAMNNSSKIKVIQHSIARKRSGRDSKLTKSSRISKRHSNNQNQLQQDIESFTKPKLQQHNSMLLKTPTKLSVRSRRKSSFYYSNAKNNSLLEMINSSQVEGQKEDNEKKKNRKRSTKKSSRLNLASEIQQLHNGLLHATQVEQGVQCNMEQQLHLDLQKLKSLEAVEYQQSYRQELNTGRDTIRDTVRDTFADSVKDSPRDSRLASKSSVLQDFGGIFENRQPRQTILTKTMRSSRASGFNNRISKYFFQNHHSFREQLNQSREKQQDEMVAVFPENKFCHAFIVHKFVQKNFYDVEVKKMFTTSESQKCEVFEFDVSCGQVYRPWRVHSVSKLLRRREDKKLLLFPKIFQQVEGYSTPLVQVVNRLLKFHPISISRLFTNAHGISPLGQYCIWIYHKVTNQFKPVFVNDAFPFYESEQKQQTEKSTPKPVHPVYGPLTNQNSIWFMLLQKALAKVLGSYYELNQTSMSDIFSMLTGCPVVNIDHITVKKLQKIFDQKIFFNKKAYVYALKKISSQNMRIDRVLGMDQGSNQSCSPIAVIQEKENTQIKMDLQGMIRTYKEICLVFFNLSFVFNQVAFPMLERRSDRISTLITFYIINQQVDEKNEIYLCLGGFGRPQLKSKITIYQQAQEQQNVSLKQLEITDPLSYYNQKYSYQGEIQKNGNYFFETQIKYGKYLCLIEADYEPDHQYYISTYTSKPITIHDIQHNYTEVDNQQTEPLEKIIAATKLRINHKRNKHLDPISEDEPVVIDYPLKIFANRRNSLDDNVLPYDFSNYKSMKKKKFKSSVSIDEIAPISSKWVIEKQFIEDQDDIIRRRQRNISGLISHIQRQQEKQQYAKLKRQLQTNEKDGVLKMMSRAGDKQEAWDENEGVMKKIKRIKKKDRRINWAIGTEMATSTKTR